MITDRGNLLDLKGLFGSRETGAPFMMDKYYFHPIKIRSLPMSQRIINDFLIHADILQRPSLLNCTGV